MDTDVDNANAVFALELRFWWGDFGRGDGDVRRARRGVVLGLLWRDDMDCGIFAARFASCVAVGVRVLAHGSIVL